MATRKGLRQPLNHSSQVWRKKKHATGGTQEKAPKGNSEVQEGLAAMSIKG